jgi:DnaJ-class molecular chaperone
MESAYANRDDIREAVERLVPTYHPAGVHGCEEKGKKYEELVKNVEQA